MDVVAQDTQLFFFFSKISSVSRFPNEVKNLKDLELLNMYFRLFLLQVIPTLSTDLKSWCM